MASVNPLDTPIWNALHTEQSRFAIGNSRAMRYLAEIGPLSATCDQTSASYDALRGLAGPGGLLAVFLEAPPEPPPGWSLTRTGVLDQMIFQGPGLPLPIRLEPKATLRRLTIADVPAMLELASLTEPGPFRQRTIELGAFWGIFREDRLLAMTGQRLQLPQFVEVSAVCTHPEARGRGYARALVATVLDAICRRSKTPFLHVLAENDDAIRVYAAAGFALRRKLHLAVLKNEA